MKHIIRCGIGILVLFFCSDGWGELYFPHIASGVNWQSEICVINTSSRKNLTGFLTPYSSVGEQVSQPLSITLGPNARRELAIADAFTDPGSIGYIILETGSEEVCGYTKFFTPGKWRAAVPAVADINNGQVYIPHIASNDNWWTGVSLLNTTSSPRNLTLAFNTGQTLPVTLAAFEHRVFTIRSLFAGQPKPDIRCATVTGANGVIGIELFGSMPASGKSYLGGILLKDDTDPQLDYPHIAGSDVWWTGIAAYNPSMVTVDAAVIPYTENGDSLPARSIRIAPESSFIADAAHMNLPAQTAWLRMSSPVPLAGIELFGTLDGRQMAGYAVVGIGRKDGIFSRLEKTGWTGIAFVNAEETATAVTLTAYSDSGVVVAEESLTLRGHEKITALPQDLFVSSIDTASYLRYSAGKWVVGFQLNSDGSTLLGGVPALAAPAEPVYADDFINAKPYIDVVVDDVVVDFGRLDDTRRVFGVGPSTGTGPYVQPPDIHPIPFPNIFDSDVPLSFAIPNWGVYYPPPRIAPWDPGTPPGNAGTALKTLPMIERTGGIGHVDPIQNPWGMTLVYAIVADADGEWDWIEPRFTLPTPIMEKGNLYAAVNTPDLPVGAIIDTEEKLAAYNRTLSEYANLGQLPLQPHQRSPVLPNGMPNPLFTPRNFIATTDAVHMPPAEFPYIIGFSEGGDAFGGGISPGQTVTEAPNPQGLVPQGEVLQVVVVEGSWTGGDAQGYLWLIPVQDDFWDFRHDLDTVPALFVDSVQKAVCTFVGQALPVIWEAPDDPDDENTTHDRRHVHPPGSIVTGGGYVNIEARVADLFDAVGQRDFGLVAYPDSDAVPGWADSF